MENGKIQIALLGLGTVGTGVYKVLQSRSEEMIPKLGVGLEIKKILVRNLEKAAARLGGRDLLTNDWQEILSDDAIDIVIEVMGGMEPARTYILEALRAGKNVITANKDLVAEDGKILMDAAKEAGRDFFFEAAVAGGIPIIRVLKQSLEANRILEIVGIVNGTTNFILTKMTEEGMEFSEALKLAQELGYAEADPTADIEGLDAARKIAILASIAFNSRVSFRDVSVEGITQVSARDIKYAREMGCHIKLLGMARSTGEEIEVSVRPMLINSRHPLAAVNDTFNAVFVRGDAVGETMFYGRGAGELPTASAIAGDVFETAKNIRYHCTGHVNCTCYKSLPVRDAQDMTSRYYIRLQVENRPGVLAAVTSVFGNNLVSIEQCIQKHREGALAEIVVITERVLERNFNDSVHILETMSMIKKISSVIRVYE